MIKNSSNLLFLFSLMSGSLIAISSSSWLGSWMGLEINLLSFIPLMINTNNSLSSEASLKYFLTQALASSMLLFSIILFMMTTHMTSFLNLNTEAVNLMINSTLMLKMGAAPFHFWFPEVMDSLTWSNSLLLMTWQKLAPLVLLSYCFSFNLMTAVIILSVLIGSLGGLNQTSLRKIMAFSSINNLGWILGAMMVSENLWLMYFLFYSFLSFTMVILFNSFKLFHVSQAFSMFSNYPVIKMLLFMSLLSLGGLPPFLGFLPKWLVIQSLTMNNQLLLVIIMVCLTLITLYFYIRLSYSAFMLNYWETQWNFNSTSMTFNMKLAMCFASISSLGLIMMSLFYLIY